MLGLALEWEHTGLFHQTLADYIATRAPEQNQSAHRALVSSIESLGANVFLVDDLE